MRRFPSASDPEGSSAIEVLLLGVLTLVVVGAVAGVVLVASLGSRSGPGVSSSVDPAAASVPEIEIDCAAATSPTVAGAAVDAGAEGVPVSIRGDVGAMLSFLSPQVPGYRMRVFEPAGHYRLPLPPGTWTLGCAPTGVAAETATVGMFAVRDPGSVYLRTRPDCPASGCCDEIVPVPDGFEDDDVAALHDALAGIGVRPSDVIERAGYPASEFSAQPPNPLVYRVVRDLRIVARLDVGGDEDAWTARVLGCPSA